MVEASLLRPPMPMHLFPERVARQLAGLFGLDPSSRTKIHSQVVAERGNAWADLAKTG